jgi:hypothetical protein
MDLPPSHRIKLLAVVRLPLSQIYSRDLICTTRSREKRVDFGNGMPAIFFYTTPYGCRVGCVHTVPCSTSRRRSNRQQERIRGSGYKLFSESRRPTYSHLQDLPVHLKWPNDIYVRLGPGPDGLRKIGGVLVNSSYQSGTFFLVIGVGINVANPRPTTSLNELIQQHNATKGQPRLEELTLEEVLADILTTFEVFRHEFEDAITARRSSKGPEFAFEPFLGRYYSRWLHRFVNIRVLFRAPR